MFRHNVGARSPPERVSCKLVMRLHIAIGRRRPSARQLLGGWPSGLELWRATAPKRWDCAAGGARPEPGVTGG